MDNTRYQKARAIRRRHLAMDDDVYPIVGVPIANAQAVIDHPTMRPSAELNTILHKHLSEALRSVSGYRHAPTEKMRWLLSQLKPRTTKPLPPLPPKGYDEEIIDLVRDTIAILHTLPQDQAQTLARRALKLLNKEFQIAPENVQHLKNVLFYNLRGYIPENIHFTNAYALLKAKPAGNA